MTDFAARRERMVERDILGRGIRDRAVLAAMRAVPREEFVPVRHRDLAYEDGPLPIARDQTISQPYIVALMVASLGLEGGERVLDVGTGSGYAAAVLSRIAARVYTIERHDLLARTAAERFERLGYGNIEVKIGDGTAGWPEVAPFTGILVSAAAREVPAPLRDQLADGGRLVVPVGRRPGPQRLLCIVRVGPDLFHEDDLTAVRFVPLVSDE
jgi:protein-L-isoaspartate(D-aspartate) O-methyltransferase